MISCPGLYEQDHTVQDWVVGPRHSQWHIMFTEGLCSNLPGQTHRQMVTWPHCRGPDPRACLGAGAAHHHVSWSHLSASLSDHWQCSGSASKQTVFPSSEHWSKKTLWWSDRSWQTLLQKGNLQRRSWVPQESGHYLLIAYNHGKNLLFTICRPVLMEIALSMN